MVERAENAVQDAELPESDVTLRSAMRSFFANAIKMSQLEAAQRKDMERCLSVRFPVKLLTFQQVLLAFHGVLKSMSKPG